MNINRRELLIGSSLAAFSVMASGKALSHENETSFGFVASNFLKAAQAQMSSGDISGLAVGISDGKNRKTKYFGFADHKKKVPVSETTQFRIASITKILTAVAILKLVEAGQLSLDQSIELYFPDYPRAREVTIYHLLTHTSGIPNWWDRLPNNTPHEFMSSGTAHRWLGRMKPSFLFTPGTSWDYSNSGYLLLGEVIAKVTGKPYEQALSNLALSRFGALQTEMEDPNLSKPNWAKGYVLEGSKLASTGFEPMPFSAGGLRSTVNDLLSFGDALFDDLILTPQSLKAMTAHAVLSDGRQIGEIRETDPGLTGVSEMGYGFGINTWVQSGERFYSHGGLISGFGSYWIHAPRTKITAVLLANTQGGTAPIHSKLRQALIDA